MDLREANHQISRRMLDVIEHRPLREKELRTGCDFADQFRENGSGDPQWFVTHRDGIESNLRRNVQTIIVLVEHTANQRGISMIAAMQEYFRPRNQVSPEQWHRSLVRRRLCRYALQVAQRHAESPQI